MLEELYAERRKLIILRQATAKRIEKLTPPAGQRWTSKEKNNELLILSCYHSELVDKLDKNKELIQLEKKPE